MLRLREIRKHGWSKGVEASDEPTIQDAWRTKQRANRLSSTGVIRGGAAGRLLGARGCWWRIDSQRRRSEETLRFVSAILPGLRYTPVHILMGLPRRTGSRMVVDLIVFIFIAVKKRNRTLHTLSCFPAFDTHTLIHKRETTGNRVSYCGAFRYLFQ